MLLFGTIALQNCGNDVTLQSHIAKDSHGKGRNIQENASSGWARPSDDRGDGGPSAVSGSDRDTVVGRPASEAHQSAEVSAHATPEVSPSGGSCDIGMLAPRRANRRYAHPSENSRTLQAEARSEILDLAKGVTYRSFCRIKSLKAPFFIHLLNDQVA